VSITTPQKKPNTRPTLGFKPVEAETGGGWFDFYEAPFCSILNTYQQIIFFNPMKDQNLQ